MKIAILSRYQNKANRGVESVVLELSKKLSKNNQVEILAGGDSDSFKKIIKGNFDVVMPMNGRLQALKASFGRLFSKYKVVIGGHSGVGRDDLINLVVARPNVFIALTDLEFNWAKKIGWGVKIIKIPNGVDLEKFKPSGDKFNFGFKGPIILSVGALEWYKYHDQTIEAVSKMDKGSLVIIGNGPQKDYLEKLGQERLAGRFKLLSVPYEKMPDVYRSCDVFTLPSWDREAFGLVYLEAMASNKPVVAPNDLSRKEIVGEAGILTDTANIDKFAESLEKALSLEWGNKPRVQAEKFNWDKVAKLYEAELLTSL